MISGIYDSRGKLINGGYEAPGTDKYKRVVGTLDASSKAGTPSTGGKGIVSNRVGISQFQGTLVVSDPGGVEKVRVGQLDDSTWGLSVTDGLIKGGSIEIGSGEDIFLANSEGISLGGSTFATAPFSVNMQGELKAEAGIIGGFTIESDKLYGGTLQTSRTVGAGSTGVIMDSAGLRGYDAVLGNTFNLPTDGSAPEFSSGVIKQTEFQLQTSSVIRTSDTVGDGSASSSGVLINNTGIYATEDNQLLEDANIKILSTGEGIFSGSIKGGQDDFMSGVGYFLGLSGGSYKLSIGDPSNSYMSWDNEQLLIKGAIELSAPLNLAQYVTGDLPIPPTIVGFNSASTNS